MLRDMPKPYSKQVGKGGVGAAESGVSFYCHFGARFSFHRFGGLPEKRFKVFVF